MTYQLYQQDFSVSRKIDRLKLLIEYYELHAPRLRFEAQHQIRRKLSQWRQELSQL